MPIRRASARLRSPRKWANSSGAPSHWPVPLDADRLAAFLDGYQSEEMLLDAEWHMVPWLMIEALIVEALLH